LTAGFLNGLFGSGGGTIIVPSMEKFLKIETHKAHATAIAIILPLSIASAVMYAQGEMPDLPTIIAVSVGGIAGGFIGAKILCKLSSSLLHKVFGVCMVAAGLRLIF
jgi:uncharacterized membrane protein YfcA